MGIHEIVGIQKIVSGRELSGKYDGLWSGYEVRFESLSGNKYIATTKYGVRGINIPVVVNVHEDGSMTLEIKE